MTGLIASPRSFPFTGQTFRSISSPDPDLLVSLEGLYPDTSYNVWLRQRSEASAVQTEQEEGGGGGDPWDPDDRAVDEAAYWSEAVHLKIRTHATSKKRVCDRYIGHMMHYVLPMSTRTASSRIASLTFYAV